MSGFYAQATMILAMMLPLSVLWQKVSSINAMWCAYMLLYAAFSGCTMCKQMQG